MTSAGGASPSAGRRPLGIAYRIARAYIVLAPSAEYVCTGRRRSASIFGGSGMTALAEDLALALDPALFAGRAGLDPDPWQMRLLRSAAPRILLNASRQS